MKTMHLFAGAGGGLLADLILGHDPIIAVEWDGYACQVLRERAAEGWFPNLRVWEGDVRLFDPSEYTGKVDCIHAGFPCTDLSITGGQAGIGEETRSGLYREAIRITRLLRPKYLFLENVTAILSLGLECVLSDISKMGFSAEWCCIRAADVGANHSRDRWFLLATNTTSKRLEGWESPRHYPQKNGEWRTGAHGDIDKLVFTESWWETEPDVLGMGDGISNRVHRLKALGNAQVPLQAAVAWKLLGGE